MLETGDQAPDFTFSDQNGEPLTLSDLRGETVVSPRRLAGKFDLDFILLADADHAVAED